MNITQQMDDWKQRQVEEYIKTLIRGYIRDASHDNFFEAYYEDSITSLIDRHNLFESTISNFGFPDKEMYQARLDATIDQLLESEWFEWYIEDETDGREGDIDRKRTDSRAFTAEKAKIANKYN